MARSTRASRLETRTARLKSAVRKKPYFVAIGPGVGLGYRRNKTAGSWVVRAADGKGGNWTQAFAVADDFEDANGTDVFNFWQAQERARAVARGGRDALRTAASRSLWRRSLIAMRPICGCAGVTFITPSVFVYTCRKCFRARP